jgi:hypothetical protein
MNKWLDISNNWQQNSHKWFSVLLKVKQFLAFGLTYFNKPKIALALTNANFVTLVINKNTYGSRY